MRQACVAPAVGEPLVAGAWGRGSVRLARRVATVYARGVRLWFANRASRKKPTSGSRYLVGVPDESLRASAPSPARCAGPMRLPMSARRGHCHADASVVDRARLRSGGDLGRDEGADASGGGGTRSWTGRDASAVETRWDKGATPPAVGGLSRGQGATPSGGEDPVVARGGASGRWRRRSPRLRRFQAVEAAIVTRCGVGAGVQKRIPRAGDAPTDPEPADASSADPLRVH